MRRLRDKSGKTILLALVLMMLAMVVGAVILTAAASAARTVRRDRQSQQDYLAVSSAAEFIRDSILSDQYSREVIRYLAPDAAGNEVETDRKETVVQPTGLMKDWLSAGIGIPDDDGVVAGCADTIRVSVSPQEGNEALGAVTAKLTMDTACNITVRLSREGAGADGCRMTLTITAVQTREERTTSADGDSGKKVNTVTTVISWSSARITKGAAEDG